MAIIDGHIRCSRCGELKPIADHDHDTGVIRGLLCHNCNRALGFLGDSIEGVRLALAYLERANAIAAPVPSMRINLLQGVANG